MIVLAAVVVPGRAHAGQLDQQQTASTQFGGSPTQTQTFTAGLTGALDQVDLELGRIGDACDVVVQIRTTSGGVPTATVLDDTVVSVSNIPPLASAAFVPALFPSPPPVSSGMQYAIALIQDPDPGCTNMNEAVFWGETTTDTYSGGQGPAPTWDFAFKTYVLAISLTQPADGSTTQDSTPAFSGIASRGVGDDLTQVTIQIFQGTSTSGTPFLELTADPNDTTGAFVAIPSTALPNGTYVAQAVQTNGAMIAGASFPNVFAVDAAPAEDGATPVPGTPAPTPVPDNRPPAFTTCPSGFAIPVFGDPATAVVTASDPDAGQTVTLEKTQGLGTLSAAGANPVTGTLTATASLLDWFVDFLGYIPDTTILASDGARTSSCTLAIDVVLFTG